MTTTSKTSHGEFRSYMKNGFNIISRHVEESTRNCEKSGTSEKQLDTPEKLRRGGPTTRRDARARLHPREFACGS